MTVFDLSCHWMTGVNSALLLSIVGFVQNRLIQQSLSPSSGSVLMASAIGLVGILHNFTQFCGIHTMRARSGAVASLISGGSFLVVMGKRTKNSLEPTLLRGAAWFRRRFAMNKSSHVLNELNDIMLRHDLVGIVVADACSGNVLYRAESFSYPEFKCLNIAPEGYRPCIPQTPEHFVAANMVLDGGILPSMYNGGRALGNYSR